MSYRTFERQSAHYFDRPHVGSPGQPVGGAAAWTAQMLDQDPSWIVHLSEHEVDDIERALDHVAALGMAPSELSRDDVPLGAFGVRVRSWHDELQHGRGLVLVRGFPVHRWSNERTELATWCLGLHLGRPGAQNPRGDLLGHVREIRDGSLNSAARLYQTNAEIRFHCDYADVVGLMCVRQAPDGGESRLASSTAIHDELWRCAPSSAERLYQPVWLDTRDEGADPALPVQPFAYDGRQVRTFYHSDYFRSAARHGGVYQPSVDLIEALDAFDNLAESERFCARMRLAEGDLQLVSNHSVVHARTTFIDDPLAPRHLLRLWLSLDHRSQGTGASST